MAGLVLHEIPKYEVSDAWRDKHCALLHYENDIKKDLSRMQECCVHIGYYLQEIDRKGLYSTIFYQGIGDYCKNVYQYALQELDLPKTTVYNLMAVAARFGDANFGLSERFKDYSFSQLCELLTFTSEMIPYASPEMTVRKLRALKKGEVVYYWIGGIGHTSQIPTELLPSASDLIEVQAETVTVSTQVEDCSDVGNSSTQVEKVQSAEVLAGRMQIDVPEVAETVSEEVDEWEEMEKSEKFVTRVFDDMDMLSRWFYANCQRSGVYPITVKYKVSTT